MLWTFRAWSCERRLAQKMGQTGGKSWTGCGNLGNGDWFIPLTKMDCQSSLKLCRRWISIIKHSHGRQGREDMQCKDNAEMIMGEKGGVWVWREVESDVLSFGGKWTRTCTWRSNWVESWWRGFLQGERWEGTLWSLQRTECTASELEGRIPGQDAGFEAWQGGQVRTERTAYTRLEDVKDGSQVKRV